MKISEKNPLSAALTGRGWWVTSKNSKLPISEHLLHPLTAGYPPFGNLLTYFAHKIVNNMLLTNYLLVNKYPNDLLPIITSGAGYGPLKRIRWQENRDIKDGYCL